MQQITLKKRLTIKGIGLHSGKEVKMRLLPAQENTGIIFKRVDLKKDNIISAKYDLVQGTTLCTMLVNEKGTKISTIEHLMASLAYFKIDNLIIEINASEIPILDGSSKVFIDKIKQVGVVNQYALKKVLRILKPVELKTDKFFVKIVPSEQPIFNVTIDFDNKVIGRATSRFNLETDDFEKDISKARTFCLYQDINYLQSNNLALGGSLDNAVVVDKETILNKEGLRYKDEFVRHKLLDAIGDLYLAGYIIKGEFFGFRCGHAANNLLLREIFKSSENYVIENDLKAPYSKGQEDDSLIFTS